MSIIMLLEGNYPPDIRVENEVKLLTHAGIQVILLALDKTGKMPLKTEEGLLTVYRKPISHFVFNLRTNNISFPVYAKIWSGFIHSVLKNHHADYMHVHDLPMLRVVNTTNLPEYYPICVDLHENYPIAIQNYEWATRFPNRFLVRPGRWHKIERESLKRTNQIIVLSEFYKSQLLEKYEFLTSDQIIVYPNVPDLAYYDNQKEHGASLDNDQNLPVLTYFGNIALRRGILTTIQALKLLIERGIKIKLLLIGPVDGNEKNYFNPHLQDPELKPYLEHIQWIDISELASYMQITDFCISPLVKNAQHESGVANKVFQYMLFGKPVIVSDCKPQADLIREAECGVVFKNQDEKDLADKIQMLLKQNNNWNNMGHRAQKIIREKYNTAIMGRKLLQLYNK
jgi:glycosyltransferase involved in cell wall biosynthesis